MQLQLQPYMRPRFFSPGSRELNMSCAIVRATVAPNMQISANHVDATMRKIRKDFGDTRAVYKDQLSLTNTRDELQFRI